MDDDTLFLDESLEVDKDLLKLCKFVIGPKRFEILAFLSANIDKFGLIKLKIKDIEQALDVSKPTVLATFAFLSEKKVFTKLKNGFYRLDIEKISSKITLGENNAYTKST